MTTYHKMMISTKEDDLAQETWYGEEFWHKNFIDLNDKWNVLKYQMMCLKEHSEAKLERMKLESFTGDHDEELKKAKTEYEAYDAVLEMMKQLRNES